ncbi:MAG: 3'(2'),5'-bisphosphate nucleotidase CysQ [Bacteroidota bacterium]|nr:3'(2'),5'-bisphosphate nucleotidase CysQ [Bacteroidota bacterium]MDP4190703.1 3'(2'),5'-bisphosphate nucleotidase CysQ [Bacteroidota bacterium]
MEIDIEKVNEIALEAGEAIMNIYFLKDKEVSLKSDESPLTKADLLSQKIISSSLKKIYPSIPIISEESKQTDYEERKQWEYFWLVDPLDGTKEFIKGNGEFTVNIALIEKNSPVLGVVFIPALNLLYFASKWIKGSFKRAQGSEDLKLKVNSDKKTDLIAVKSRSHSSSSEEEFFSKLPVSSVIQAGSSLKFCLIAEGVADIYLRSGHTYEWDTAAGQAILEKAGGYVYSMGESLKYNKATMLNESFVASANLSYLK